MTQGAYWGRFGFDFSVKHISLISIDFHEPCSLNLVNPTGISAVMNNECAPAVNLTAKRVL